MDLVVDVVDVGYIATPYHKNNYLDGVLLLLQRCEGRVGNACLSIILAPWPTRLSLRRQVSGYNVPVVPGPTSQVVRSSTVARGGTLPFLGYNMEFKSRTPCRPQKILLVPVLIPRCTILITTELPSAQPLLSFHLYSVLSLYTFIHSFQGK